jgi:cytochrome c oxidase subunit IV
MWDATDASGQQGHTSKYLALGAYLLACLVVLVGLNRLVGLDGAGLLVAFLIVAGGLLRVAFIPLFRRLHATPAE